MPATTSRTETSNSDRRAPADGNGVCAQVRSRTGSGSRRKARSGPATVVASRSRTSISAPLASLLACLTAWSAEVTKVFHEAAGILSEAEHEEPWARAEIVRNRRARMDVDEVMRRYRQGLPLKFNLFDDVELETVPGSTELAGSKQPLSIVLTQLEGISTFRTPLHGRRFRGGPD